MTSLSGLDSAPVWSKIEDFEMWLYYIPLKRKFQLELKSLGARKAPIICRNILPNLNQTWQFDSISEEAKNNVRVFGFSWEVG